jgi:hypothetical protein
MCCDALLIITIHQKSFRQHKTKDVDNRHRKHNVSNLIKDKWHTQ